MKLLRFISLLCFTCFLFGDVMYEMVSTSEGMMGMKGETNMRIFVKGDRSLTEMTAESPMAGTMTDIKIIRLDKGVIWSIDHEKKEYAEHSITDMDIEPETGEEQEMPPANFKVVRTGEKKKILNKDCEEVIVTMDAEDEEGTMALKQTMWVTTEMAGYQEIQKFQQQMSGSDFAASSAMMGGNKKSYEDFKKKISEIEGFPLEITMEMAVGAEGMSFSFVTHSEVTKIETKPINDKVFEIPTGYSLRE